MTNFLVTGQPDWWHVFWVLATWSAAYMVAAVVLREVFAKPVTPMERYGLWFGRIVGIVGASIIFAYGYRTTGELDRAEKECEHYKALAAAKANEVSKPTQGPQYTTVSITGKDGTEIQVRNVEHDYQSARSLLGATERTQSDRSGDRSDFAADGCRWSIVDPEGATSRTAAGSIGRLPVGASIDGTTGTNSVY